MIQMGLKSFTDAVTSIRRYSGSASLLLPIFSFMPWHCPVMFEAKPKTNSRHKDFCQYRSSGPQHM